MKRQKAGKESRREKKERREENAKIHQQLFTVAIPVLIVVFVLIAAYVYLKTRPIEG